MRRLLGNRLLSQVAHLVEQQPSTQRQTLYLTHIKWVTGKQQVEKYFSRFGKVNDVAMFFDPETGLHRGFASVTFEKPEAATAAIQNKPHVIDGDVVGLELFMPLKSPKKFQTL
uniref:RRM domain-containing protein n=1 Tax=Panagrellus redivivus TaxID=6233 RepID=A0A7E4V5W6_PANRE